MHARKEIIEKIKSIIVDRLNLSMTPEAVDHDSPLFGMGLGLDSIDSLELVVGVEEAFDLDITKNDMGVFFSVNTLVDFIVSKTKKQSYHGIDMARKENNASWIKPYQFLREQSLLYPLDTGLLEILDTGDEISFIAELISGNDIILEPHKALNSLLLDDEGNIVDLVTVLMLEGRFLIMTGKQNGSPWIMKSAAEKGLVCKDISGEITILAVEGPYSWKLLKPLVGFELTGLNYLHSMELEVKGSSLLLLRAGSTNEYGYRLFVPVEVAESLVTDLEIQGGENALVLRQTSREVEKAVNVAALEVRYPKLGVTVEKNQSPYLHEVSWMVDLNKSDFRGKAAAGVALTTIKSRKVLFNLAEGVSLDREVDIAKCSVSLGGKVLGSVVNIEWSPGYGRWIGLALLNEYEPYDADSGLQLILGSGESFPITQDIAPMFMTLSANVQME